MQEAGTTAVKNILKVHSHADQNESLFLFCALFGKGFGLTCA